MDILVDYWCVILLAVVFISVAITFAINFFKGSTEEQISKIKEWLLYATSLAEKELGSGTGKLKLRYVYDMFVAKFPWLVKLISFDYFGKLVDEVLVDMNDLLNTNTAVRSYVISDSEKSE